MKTFRQIRESIIDIPRSTYAPMVFDDADTSNPKIKQSVIGMIEKQIEDFEKEYPILKYTLIGSILTKRYRKDADLDINILFDVPADKAEDERLRLSKKYLSSSNPDNIQGKLIPNTEHPVNYYFLTDEKTYDDQNGKADAVFDIKNQKFVKRPEDYVFDMELYLKDFNAKVHEIDILKGELKRDIIDYDELSELKPDEIKDLEKKVKEKLDEIEEGLKDLGDIYDVVDKERRNAFDTDMTPEQIKTFSIKNRLPKNVVYKMLEKFHYLTFLKKCKKILDDGQVTDDEIKSLKKEETMKNFKQFLESKVKEDMTTGAVAGAGDDSETVPVHMKKKKKKKVLKRYESAIEESDANWAKSLEKINKQKQLDNISDKDKETLMKIAALLDKEKKRRR